MNTHSLTSRPNSARQARDFRKNLFLLVPFVGVGIAIVILFCPLMQNTLSTTSATSVPAQTAIVSSINQGFWHTECNSIIDVNGSSIRISGVNWSGFEPPTWFPVALESRTTAAFSAKFESPGTTPCASRSQTKWSRPPLFLLISASKMPSARPSIRISSISTLCRYLITSLTPLVKLA